MSVHEQSIDFLPSLVFMSFETSQPDTEIKLDPIEVQNKTFATAWKGYKVEEVRGYLAKVAFSIRELNGELAGIKNRLYEIEHLEKAADQDDFKRITKAEETATQIIHDATEAAKALRTQAEQYFEATRKRADAEASAVIEAAKKEAEAANGAIYSQVPNNDFEVAARREIEIARQKAAEIIEKSKSEGRAMIDQARDLRNEILADLRHKRSVLDGEIADLATRRIEAYQSLSRAVQLISEAGSIVAAGEVEGSSNDQPAQEPQSGTNAVEDFEPQVQEPDGADQGPEPEKIKPSRPLAELHGISVGNSEIEIGSHLEEGILRVFSKEDQAASTLEAKTEPDVAEVIHPDVNDLLGGSDEVGSQSQVGPQSSDAVEQLDVIELERDDTGVSSGDVGSIGDTAPNEIDPTAELSQIDHIDLSGDDNQEIPNESLDDPGNQISVEDSKNEDTSNPVAESQNSPEGAPESELQSRLAGEELGDEKVETPVDFDSPEVMAPPPIPDNQLPEIGSKRGERSKRADEILARIRSLRLSESASESATSPESHVDPNHNSEADAAVDEVTELSSSEKPQSGVSGAQTESGNSDGEWDRVETDAPVPVDAATEELLSVREEILAPVATMFFKKAKRLLADEQNELLDKVRRSAGSKVSLEELLDEKVQMDSIAIASLDFFEQVRLGVVELFSDGVSQAFRREISQHAVLYSEEFAKELVLPLRRKIEEILGEDSAAEDQTTVSVIGSIYRDMRSNRLEALISQYVNTVFCATILKESGYESFVWATDPGDTPCADCLDNSLAGATAAGEQFPTGHYHPAIHSGCRCLLVPFIA